MSGRVLQDDGNVRFVELSALYDRRAPALAQQTIAALLDDWNPRVVLARPGEEGPTQFELSFEEMNVLISAYQTFLADREVLRSPSSHDCEPFCDEPPF